jgi:N-acetyl-alpha-D-muramate 1-phosphate uridylyltransferase
MLTVAILAGGLGTRVRDLTGPDLPKALLPIAGRPFIEHKLMELARGGATRVVFLVGHGADRIRAVVGDGTRFGLAVEYVDDGPSLLGTAGAVRRALDHLGPAFFLTYGDTLLDVSLGDLEGRLLDGGALGAMTVLENDDRWETSNVDVAGGLVVAYDKPSQPGTHKYLDYGFLAFRSAAFAGLRPDRAADLTGVIRALIDRRALVAVPVAHRFHDIGNQAAVRETEAWLLQQERT